MQKLICGVALFLGHIHLALRFATAMAFNPSGTNVITARTTHVEASGTVGDGVGVWVEAVAVGVGDADDDVTVNSVCVVLPVATSVTSNPYGPATTFGTCSVVFKLPLASASN